MQVNVRYLDNLKIEASFDDFKIISDQPVRYKGDGTAPGPYDYFLASSAMCAAYFAKVYCNSRDIPTEDIRISQQNIVDPDNRYKQSFVIHAELPASISEKDKKGILASMNRCTVKRVIQNEIDFKIEAKEELLTVMASISLVIIFCKKTLTSSPFTKTKPLSFKIYISSIFIFESYYLII